jgi:threonine dehydratase
MLPPASGDGPALPGAADVLAAAGRLAETAHRTPVMTSRTLDARAGASVFLKCENFQRTGSFKFRGAYNALSRLDAAARARGVLTYSSGNHAQAIALAGRLLGVPTTVVMPADATPVKLAATRGYGAEVVTYDRRRDRREALGTQLAQARGLTLVPPYDHADVIAGQGTAALELLAEVPALDLLLVPCGGGGLLSGSALATLAAQSACRVIGVEPALADDATRSFRTGELQTVHDPPTVADGARTPSLGRLTFPLVRRFVHDMVTVSDEAILSAMRFLWERTKIVVEPTGALAVTALLERVVPLVGTKVGVIISGGNVDLALAAAWFGAAGRGDPS